MKRLWLWLRLLTGIGFKNRKVKIVTGIRVDGMKVINECRMYDTKTRTYGEPFEEVH